MPTGVIIGKNMVLNSQQPFYGQQNGSRSHWDPADGQNEERGGHFCIWDSCLSYCGHCHRHAAQEQKQTALKQKFSYTSKGGPAEKVRKPLVFSIFLMKRI